MKGYYILIICCWFTAYSTSFGQVISLWPDQVPNSLPSTELEQDNSGDIRWITHVQVPSLEIFLPAKQYATGHGVLICPGGGYRGLAYDWEGTDVAKWLNGHGIAAFVLKYRLPYAASVDVDHLAPLQDAQRAIRILRKHASVYNLDPQKIGVMGFSAGGHLASTLGTRWTQALTFASDSIDEMSAKPNFMALIYPVISMQEGITHQGSKKHLLGKNPEPSLVSLYSNELQVSQESPPTFLVHSQDDKGVPVSNSLLMYQALLDENIPVEMHLLPKGGHGYSLGRNKYPMNTWPDMFVKWVQALSVDEGN